MEGLVCLTNLCQLRALCPPSHNSTASFKTQAPARQLDAAVREPAAHLGPDRLGTARSARKNPSSPRTYRDRIPVVRGADRRDKQPHGPAPSRAYPTRSTDELCGFGLHSRPACAKRSFGGLRRPRAYWWNRGPRQLSEPLLYGSEQVAGAMEPSTFVVHRAFGCIRRGHCTKLRNKDSPSWGIDSTGHHAHDRLHQPSRPQLLSVSWQLWRAIAPTR